MKFAGVILLGVVAAVCMSGLMVFLPRYIRGPVAAENIRSEVHILVATKAISAMSIVDADSVETKTIRRQDAPEHYLSDPVQVIGKILLVPVMTGQAYSKTFFASEGTGLQLASALPNGMRAVGVSLADYSGLEGLLYPGSRVDVLTSYKPANANEAVTKTLLQNIQVLGIENDTIVSSQDSKKSSASERNKKRMVSLMVDPEQAKVLQSAIQDGTISLSMRNPLDAAALVEPTPIVEPPPEPKLAKAESAQTKPAEAEDPMWEVGVLRQGRLSETVKFKLLRGAS